MIDALLKDLRMSYESKVAQYTKKVQSKEEKSCDQCVDVSNVSLCMDPDCRKFLCEFCCKYHKISRDTLNHELQPVDSIDVKALKVPHQPMSCQIHTDEILKFYLENCCALICRDCRDLHHKGHNVDRVEQMAKMKGVLFSRLIKTLTMLRLSLIVLLPMAIR